MSIFKSNSNKKALQEKRMLPIGMTEFEEWSDRIISGTMLPVPSDTQKLVLTAELIALPSTEDVKEDLYFIKRLRKCAIDQIASAKARELRDKIVTRQEAEKAAKAAEAAALVNLAANGLQEHSNNPGEATPINTGVANETQEQSTEKE